MRRKLVIAVILCQVLVLAFMAGGREYISLFGRTVFLRTAPIDPRDLFRGDYVRLRYDVSLVPFAKVDPVLAELYKKDKSEKTVYASLKEGENNLAELVSLSLTRPEGLFLKGRIASGREAWSSGGGIPVQYGIEAFFVQQGKGVDIEKMRGTRTTVQVPLEMELAVSDNGTAVIRSYRWSPIGIGIEMIASRQSSTMRGGSLEPGKKSAKFRITFKNVSDKPMAFVNLPGYCSLTLEPVNALPEAGASVPDKPFCAGLKPTAQDVTVFAPDATGTVEIDLADAAWLVIAKGKLVETGELAWHERFRIVYHPPDAAACSSLEQAGIVWHGRIATAAFHGRGTVD